MKERKEMTNIQSKICDIVLAFFAQIHLCSILILLSCNLWRMREKKWRTDSNLCLDPRRGEQFMVSVTCQTKIFLGQNIEESEIFVLVVVMMWLLR